MRKIPPNLIQSFVSFCESENIQQAAEKEELTQPALSKQLQLLESQLPYKLFTFRGKKKVLTAFGEKMYIELKGKISSVHQSVDLVCNTYGSEENSRIRFAARPEIIERIAGQLTFSGRIDYFEKGHQEIVDSILTGSLDMGISHTVPDKFELGSVKLFKERFVLATPKKLNVKKNLKLSSCIAYKAEDVVLRQGCEKLGFDYENLTIKRTISNYRMIAKMIEAGMGWSVIPMHIQIDEKKCNISKLKLDGINNREFMLIYRLELKEAVWFKGFVRMLKSLCS